MKGYLESGLSDIEEQKVIKHLADCELCKDALEGLELMSDKTKLEDMVAEINQNLRESLKEKPPGKTISLSTKVYYSGAAASIVILIGLLFYFNKPFGSEMLDMSTAQELKVEKRQIPPKPITSERINDTIQLIEDHQNIQQEQNKQENVKITVNEKIKEVNNTNSKNEPYKVPLDKMRSVDSSIDQFEIAIRDQIEIKTSERERIYIDIASNQPIEYYLAEIIVPDIQLIEALTEEEQSGSIHRGDNVLQEQMHFFTVVELMPEFPGGFPAMTKYLSKNLKFPKAAKKANIQGRVNVSFIIEEDGRVSNVRIINGIGGGCDEEAMRVILSMPAWDPAIQNGQPVKVLFNLPVKFEIR